MRGRTAPVTLEETEEVFMYWDDHMNGADWLWMSLSMALWIVVLGVVVYAAVRLAQRDRRT